MSVKIKNIFKIVSTVFVVGIFLILLLDMVIMPWYTGRGEEFELIDVNKWKFKKARQRLNSMGLYVNVIDSAVIPNAPSGIVWKQIPKPGEEVKEGRAVRLVVTKSPNKIKMPRLIGKDFKTARMELQELGVNTNINMLSIYKFSEDKPKGVVIAQSVEPGQKIKPSSPIHITISKGRPSEVFEVPDLVGRSLNNAKKQLQINGLQPGKIKYVKSEDLTPRTVVSQSPEAGEKSFKPIKVNMTVTE